VFVIRNAHGLNVFLEKETITIVFVEAETQACLALVHLHKYPALKWETTCYNIGPGIVPDYQTIYTRRRKDHIVVAQMLKEYHVVHWLRYLLCHIFSVDPGLKNCGLRAHSDLIGSKQDGRRYLNHIKSV
jgi:hypothetical protein